MTVHAKEGNALRNFTHLYFKDGNNLRQAKQAWFKDGANLLEIYDVSIPGTVPFTVTVVGLRVTARWTPPPPSGFPITAYQLRYKETSAVTWTTVTAFASTVRTWQSPTLTQSTDYEFQMRAQNELGWSRWTSSETITTSAGKPSKPAKPTVSRAGAGTIRVRWVAPNANGSPITAYRLQFKKTSVNTWTTAASNYTSLTTTISGLADATSYDFRVAARNAGGWSDDSDKATITTAAAIINPPDKPAAPTLVRAGQGNVKVSWVAPDSDDAPITAYRVQYKKASASSWTTDASNITELFHIVIGLDASTAYDFRVAARNSGGWSTPSDSTEITTAVVVIVINPPAKPAAPAVATAGQNKIKVTWVAPDQGGAAITAYRLQYKLTSASNWTTVSDTLTGLTRTVSGLVASTSYDFRVAAFNSGGWSQNSNKATITTIAAVIVIDPPEKPDAPTLVRAGVGNIKATWTAPAAGDALITDYRLQYKKTADNSWTTADDDIEDLEYTVTGLDAGTSYDFRVAAMNSGGWGPDSDAATLATFGVPGAPTWGNFTTATRAITVRWTAPSSNGGSAVTGYRIEYREGTSGSWSLGGSPGANATSFTVSRLDPNTAHQFRIRAINDVGNGAWSANKSGTTRQLVAPDPVRITSSQTWTVPDTWDDVTNITFTLVAGGGGGGGYGFSLLTGGRGGSSSIELSSTTYTAAGGAGAEGGGGKFGPMHTLFSRDGSDGQQISQSFSKNSVSSVDIVVGGGGGGSAGASSTNPRGRIASSGSGGTTGGQDGARGFRHSNVAFPGGNDAVNGRDGGDGGNGGQNGGEGNSPFFRGIPLNEPVPGGTPGTGGTGASGLGSAGSGGGGGYVIITPNVS